MPRQMPLVIFRTLSMAGFFLASGFAASVSVALVRSLARRYPLRGVAGHEHVAPGRKADPGAGFDWNIVIEGAGLPIAYFDAVGPHC